MEPGYETVCRVGQQLAPTVLAYSSSWVEENLLDDLQTCQLPRARERAGMGWVSDLACRFGIGS